MVIIDKRKDNIRLLFTLNEKTTIQNANYLLVLHSAYDKTTSRFMLPANTSQFQTRFDEFIFSNETFKYLNEGFYYYSIYQTLIESMNETTMGEPVETGLVKVIGIVEEKFISIYKEETADDFITYNG